MEMQISAASLNGLSTTVMLPSVKGLLIWYQEFKQFDLIIYCFISFTESTGYLYFSLSLSRHSPSISTFLPVSAIYNSTIHNLPLPLFLYISSHSPPKLLTPPTSFALSRAPSIHLPICSALPPIFVSHHSSSRTPFTKASDASVCM